MTGAVQAAAGAAASIGMTLTLFSSSSSQTVAGNGIGSVTPDNFKGSQAYFDSGSTRDFLFQTLSAAAPAASFFRVRVQDGSGAWREFLRSAATFSDLGALGKQWVWGTGSNRVWQQADSGETKLVIFDGI